MKDGSFWLFNEDESLERIAVFDSRTQVRAVVTAFGCITLQSNNDIHFCDPIETFPELFDLAYDYFREKGIEYEYWEKVKKNEQQDNSDNTLQ